MGADRCPHDPQHLPRSDDGVVEVEPNHWEQVRHASSGYELQTDGSCAWVEVTCNGRYYSERELFELRETNDIHKIAPVRAGHLPCDQCQPGSLMVHLHNMERRDLSTDYEARAVFFRAEGKWPARKTRGGGFTTKPLPGEQEPAADGTPIRTGPDERFEPDEAKAWDE